MDDARSEAGVTPVESLGADAAFAGIRSDNIFQLMGDLAFRPGKLGIDGAGEMVAAIGLAVISLVVALVLAFLTYRLGDFVASAAWGQPPTSEPT